MRVFKIFQGVADLYCHCIYFAKFFFSSGPWICHAEPAASSTGGRHCRASECGPSTSCGPCRWMPEMPRKLLKHCLAYFQFDYFLCLHYRLECYVRATARSVEFSGPSFFSQLDSCVSSVSFIVDEYFTTREAINFDFILFYRLHQRPLFQLFLRPISNEDIQDLMFLLCWIHFAPYVWIQRNWFLLSFRNGLPFSSYLSDKFS